MHVTAWGKSQDNVGQEAMREGRQVSPHWRLREAPLSATNVPEHQNDIRSARAHKPSQGSKVGPKTSSHAKFYADPSKACMRIDAAGARTKFGSGFGKNQIWLWIFGSRYGQLPKFGIRSLANLFSATNLVRNTRIRLHYPVGAFLPWLHIDITVVEKFAWFASRMTQW